MLAAKKRPATVSPGAGSQGLNRLDIARLTGPLHYNKFIRYLQEVPGYSMTPEECDLIRRKKYVFDDWLRVAVPAKLITKLERRVLEFIGDRTLRYGKVSEVITRSQFLGGFMHGVVLEVGPAVSNARQWYQAVESLRAKGFVSSTQITSGQQHYHTVYTLSLDVILRSKGVVQMSKVSEFRRNNKPKTAVQNDTTPHPDPQCHFALLNIRSNNEVIESTTARVCTRERRVRSVVRADNALECKNNILTVLTQVSDRIHAKREAKVRKGANTPKQVTMSTLNATWQQVMLEQHGSAVNAIGLTTAEFGIFKSATRNHHFTFRWEDFFRWVIQSWRFIVSDQKRKVDYARKMEGHSGETQPQLPQAPSLSAVTRRFAMFAKRYTDSMYVPVAGSDTLDELAAARKKASDLTARAEEAERKLALADAAVAELAKLRVVQPTRKTLPSGRVAGVDYDDDGLADWPMEG